MGCGCNRGFQRTFHRGDTVKWTAEVVDDDSGEAISLDGASIEVVVREMASSKAEIASGSTADGVVTLLEEVGGYAVEFPLSAFEGLDVGRYYYAVQVEFASGEKSTVESGSIFLRDGI